MSSKFKVQSSKFMVKERWSMVGKAGRVTHHASRITFLLLAAFCSLLAVRAQSDGSQQNLTGKAGTFAIMNARIVTVSGAVIENGTLLIQDGKIAAVGTNVSIPSGAERIDAKGLSVFPGMIDAATNMGLAEIPAVAATVDLVETGDMNPNAKAIKGINPHSSHVNVTRVNGITTVLSLPAAKCCWEKTGNRFRFRAAELFPVKPPLLI